MNKIMKKKKSLEESDLLIKSVIETIKNKAKEQRENFSICYQTLQRLAYQGMLRHPLRKFEIQNYYQNDAQQSSKNKFKFNGVYSRNDLLK